MVITLDQPMRRDDTENAGVIFFACFNMNSKDERKRIESFYRELIPCLKDETIMKKIRSFPDPGALYKILAH